MGKELKKNCKKENLQKTFGRIKSLTLEYTSFLSDFEKNISCNAPYPSSIPHYLDYVNGVISNMNNLGGVFDDEIKVLKSKKWELETICQWQDDKEDLEYIGLICDSKRLANYYMNEQNGERAIKVLEETLNKTERNNSNRGEYNSLIHNLALELADIFIQNEDLEKAEKSLRDNIDCLIRSRASKEEIKDLKRKVEGLWGFQDSKDEVSVCCFNEGRVEYEMVIRHEPQTCIESEEGWWYSHLNFEAENDDLALKKAEKLHVKIQQECSKNSLEGLGYGCLHGLDEVYRLDEKRRVSIYDDGVCQLISGKGDKIKRVTDNSLINFFSTRI